MIKNKLFQQNSSRIDRLDVGDSIGVIPVEIGGFNRFLWLYLINNVNF